MADVSYVGIALGGGLALVGSAFGTWFGKHLEARYAAEQLARAFAGEMKAIINIVEIRNYIALLHSIATNMENAGNPTYFALRANEEYRAVYKSNCGRLGILPKNLPTLIAVVYTQISSVLEDFHSMDSIYEKRAAEPKTVEELALRYRAAANLMSDTLDKARVAICAIEKIYGDV